MTETMRKQRLLIVAPRFRYMNPTGEAFLEGLQKRFDVVFHGPGYVPHEELEPDLRRLWERKGPFDAVILHQYFLFGTLMEAAPSIYPCFNLKRFLRDFPSFGGGLSELPCQKFGVLLLLDPYALTEQHQNLMDRFPGAFISWPIEFVHPHESYFDVPDAIAPPTTIYHGFFSAHPERLIPIHHVLRDNEFELLPWEVRNWDVAVPGVGYVRRVEAAALLRRQAFRIAPKPLKLQLGRFLYGGRPQRFDSGLRLIQSCYRAQIRSSRACYVEGSGFNMPVRKYLEVPAYGSLLVAIPCAGAEGMGLRDGETYVRAEGRDLPDLLREWLGNPEGALEIIRKAQEMLRAKHTQSARARQFERCLNAIQEGHYRGADWIAGDLALRI